MIGLDQNRHAARALVKAATGADARRQFGEASRGELLLQSLSDLFRVADGTRSAGIVVGSAIGADEEIMFALRHAGRFDV
jgi:hypothetical protein